MAAVGNVLIVGGGVAGLTLALGLRQRGIACTIAEIKRDWSVLGVGFTLTGATLRALDAVGLRDRIIDAAFPFDAAVVCDEAGTVMATIPFARLNGADRPANVGIMRPVLHAILSDAAQAAGTEIRLGVTVAALRSGERAIEAAFTDGRADRFDLVVGADGFRSTVRALAFPDAPAARFTGQMVWRAMVPRPPAVDTMQVYYGANGKPGFVPLPHEEMLLFFTQNSAAKRRLPEDGLLPLLRAGLGGYRKLMELCDGLHAPEAVSYRYMDALLMPPPWHRGRVVLIGDAAHITTPHLASGAGIAIEDAVVLAEQLGAAAALEPALADFMARRYERCRRVIENSLQLAAWEQDSQERGADSAGLMRRSWDELAQPI